MPPNMVQDIQCDEYTVPDASMTFLSFVFDSMHKSANFAERDLNLVSVLEKFRWLGGKPYSAGGPCQHNRASMQGVASAQKLDNSRNVKVQLGSITLLPYFAIDLR